jgi:hypothetical protein
MEQYRRGPSKSGSSSRSNLSILNPKSLISIVKENNDSDDAGEPLPAKKAEVLEDQLSEELNISTPNLILTDPHFEEESEEHHPGTMQSSSSQILEATLIINPDGDNNDREQSHPPSFLPPSPSTFNRRLKRDQ